MGLFVMVDGAADELRDRIALERARLFRAPPGIQERGRTGIIAGLRPHVYIVTLAGSPAQLRSELNEIAGARFVRELPPRRAVVALRTPADRRRLASLPAVEAVVPDALEHPDRTTS